MGISGKHVLKSFGEYKDIKVRYVSTRSYRPYARSARSHVGRVASCPVTDFLGRAVLGLLRMYISRVKVVDVEQMMWCAIMGV